jgi:aryl carrier-like protein
MADEGFGAHVADSGPGTFYRSGDLGFVFGDQLFVTGRVKELIIIRGRNIYPQDIETTVESELSGTRSGAVAAFAVEADDGERLVVMMETEAAGNRSATADLAAAVRRAVAQHHQVQAHAVVLVPPGSIPRSPSGKPKRSTCRETFTTGAFDPVYVHVGATPPSPAGSELSGTPHTQIETALARIWAESLAIERVAVTDNIFDMGGDSMTMMEITARAARDGLLFDPADLVAHPTIAELAPRVRTESPPPLETHQPDEGKAPSTSGAGYTSSDFPSAGLSQEEFDRLMVQIARDGQPNDVG